jgi:hypothetical protein
MHKTDWNKKLTDPSDYESSWEWTVDNSEYHFDNTRQDEEGEWYKILGKFGPASVWQEEMQRVIERSAPINWETRKYFGDSEDVSPMLAQEEYDIVQGGGNPKLEITNMLDEFDDLPVLRSMCEYFGLEDAPDLKDGLKKKYRSHVQFTGQMFNRHIDKLWEWCPSDPERICRIAVFLQDWEPGQFYMYGTKVLTHWKAGEAHIFDWANVPHATANCSSSPRATLLLTGLKSELTRRIIERGSRYNIFKL